MSPSAPSCKPMVVNLGGGPLTMEAIGDTKSADIESDVDQAETRNRWIDF